VARRNTGARERTMCAPHLGLPPTRPHRPLIHLAAPPPILPRTAGIEWAPDDENVLAVCAADGTTTLWDMSLEEDEEAEIALTEGGAKKAAGGNNKPKVTPSTQDARLKDIPPQLLFLHAGA
jgi:hypothetical protein